MENVARVDDERSSGAPNIHIAPPNTESVIHPRVPAWTWVSSVARGGSHTSVPLRMPITTVITTIDDSFEPSFHLTVVREIFAGSICFGNEVTPGHDDVCMFG